MHTFFKVQFNGFSLNLELCSHHSNPILEPLHHSQSIPCAHLQSLPVSWALLNHWPTFCLYRFVSISILVTCPLCPFAYGTLVLVWLINKNHSKTNSVISIKYTNLLSQPTYLTCPIIPLAVFHLQIPCPSCCFWYMLQRSSLCLNSTSPYFPSCSLLIVL